MVLDLDTPATPLRTAAAVPSQHLRTPGGDSCHEGSLVLKGFRPQHARAPVDTRIHYCLYGIPGKPVVAALGGISASRHLLDSPDGKHAGWWRYIAGSGLGIDTDCYQVLSLDYFTGLDCSAGECRAVTTADQADVLAATLDDLGIEGLHACVGASYGAMVALQFAARHPSRLERVVAISGADKAHPMAAAFRGLQREVVRLGLRHGAGTEALQIARALGLVTYRSHSDYARRFVTGSVEQFLLGRARAYAARTAPAAFLRLSESLDTHSVDPSAIRTSATLIAADPDLLVPVEQMRDLAARLGGRSRLIEISSRYGHDAFLKEHHQIADLLAAALDEDCRHDHRI